MTRWFFCTVLLAALAACTPPTYINIPPEKGDVALSNPNAGNVQQIIVASVRRVLEHDPLGKPYELRLPEGTTPETYALVVTQLGADALVPSDVPSVTVGEDGKVVQGSRTTPTPGGSGGGDSLGRFPTVEVRSIRMRAARGQVDVVRPSMSGRSLVTVYLDWEAGFGWAAGRVRAWRVDPEVQPRPVGPSTPQSPSQ